MRADLVGPTPTDIPPAATVALHAPPPRRHRRRFWLRRHPILATLLVVLVAGAVAGGIVVSRAASTVTTIRSVSTPPPVVALAPEVPAVAPAAAGTTTTAAEPPATQPPATDPLATGPSSRAGAAPSTSPAGQTQPRQVDTRPARDALAQAGVTYESGGGILATLQNQAGGVTDLAQGAAEAAGADQTTLAPMTILLMGVDARPGEAIDVGVRPDALAVLRLDPEAGTCRLLNIPRDSRVNLPGYGPTKINHALAVGGIPYQELVVEAFLGLPVDRYALIDFGGVEALVDAVGGVTISVSEPFAGAGVIFAAGEQTLSGDDALVYARYRGGPDGDFGRIRRQQQIVRAILAKGSTLDPLTLVRELLPQLQDHVRTDLDPLELVALGSRFVDTCTDETLVTMNLDGTIATFDDPLFGIPLSYVVVPDDEVRRKVAALIAAS